MSNKVKCFGFVLLILFLILSKYHSLFYHFFDWDEAQIMSMSWAMTQGITLYTEMPEIHPIFHFFIFYPFFLFFDPDTVPHLIRIFNILYIGGLTYTLIVLIFQWLRCYWTSFFAGVLMIFCFGYYDWTFSSYGEFYTLLPILYSLLIVVRNTVINRGRGILIGLLWGIAFFIKQVAVFDAMGIACIFFILNKQNSIKKLKISVFFFYGFLIAGFIAFLYPLFHSSVYSSFDSMILNSFFSYSTKSSSDLINIFELLCRYFWILKTILIQISGHSQMVLTGLFVLIFLSLINRLIHADGKNKEEFPLFYGCIFWFGFVILGLSLIERYYVHYAIQILPPFIMLLCFFIKGLSGRIRKVLIVFLSSYLILINFMIFYKDTIKNGFYYIPEKVRTSLEIADAVKKYCRPDEKIFLLRDSHLDVFYLSGRFSSNGIYMFIVMDSTHTNDIRTENERKKIFIDELPKLIILGDYRILSLYSPLQNFLDKIISEKYKIIKEIGPTKIYSRI